MDNNTVEKCGSNIPYITINGENGNMTSRLFMHNADEIINKQ